MVGVMRRAAASGLTWGLIAALAWPAAAVAGPAEAEAVAEAEPEAEAEAESESESESEGEAEAESEPESEPEGEAESEAESEAGAESAPESDAESEAEAETETEAKAKAKSKAKSKAETETETEPDEPPAPRVPPPTVTKATRTVTVAVGLAPEAPGTKEERALVDALERSAAASVDPKTTVRRLPSGAGDGRLVCRERRDDLVLQVGYVPGRDRAVVLARDCRLDHALAVRDAAAADEIGLVGALWDEREELVRGGMRERRTVGRLSPRARGAIIASVAVVVIGAAVSVLVVNALRDEEVVVTVSP